MLYEAVQRTVEEHVIASSGSNVIFLIRYEIMKLIGVAPCSVYDSAGDESIFIRHNRPAVCGAADISNFGVEHEFNAVLLGAFTQSNIKSERTDNACRGSIKSADSIIRDVRLYLSKFIFFEYFKTGNTVGNSPLIKILNASAVCFVRAYDKRPDLLERDIKFLAKRCHHLIASYIHLCLESAGLCIVARMDYAAVGLGSAAADILVLLDNKHRTVIARELSCHRTSCYACSDDDHVK